MSRTELYFCARLADKRCASSVCPLRMRRSISSFMTSGLFLPYAATVSAVKSASDTFPRVEVRIAKHVKQLGSHGSGLRQLFGRIGPASLVVPDLAHLGDRQLIVRVVREFRLEIHSRHGSGRPVSAPGFPHRYELRERLAEFPAHDEDCAGHLPSLP